MKLLKRVFWVIATMVTLVPALAYASDQCDEVKLTRFAWQTVAWPSLRFIEAQGINYMGRCDKFSVSPQGGMVIAEIANADEAEKIRCKYEIAGLAEITNHNSLFFIKSRDAVTERCRGVIHLPWL